MTLVSVIMPAFNAGKFLREAIESILNQTYQEWELLVFDDGSTDGTAEYLEQIATQDARIRLKRSHHLGYTVHLNRGIEQALGKYIARMDADDVCLPQRLSKQVDFLESSPDCVAVGSSVIHIDSEGLPFTVVQAPLTHSAIDEMNLNCFGSAMTHSSVMMRADAVRSLGSYTPDFEPAEDLDLWLRMAEVGSLSNIAEPLLKYRVHNQMISQTKRDLQRFNAQRAVRNARERRGLLEEQSVVEFPVFTPVESLAFTRMEKAFANGFPTTAVTYSARAIKENLFSLRAWNILVRACYSALRAHSR